MKPLTGSAVLSILALDLECIIVKAVEEHGWTLALAKAVAWEYRRYLILCAQNPDAPIVPSNMVDDFWHLHILDTQKYGVDCQHCLGYFLHHFPYFGMRGERDAKNLRQAWLETLELYERTFGEKPDAKLWPIHNRCPNCGRRCTRGPEPEPEAEPEREPVQPEKKPFRWPWQPQQSERPTLKSYLK